MAEFFPPDVRVRLLGDEGKARELLGAARRTLFRALQMRATGRSSHINLTEWIDETTFIHVALAGKTKIVSIGAVPPPPAVVPEQPPLPVAVAEGPPLPGMLSGCVFQGLTVSGTVNGRTVNQLDSFDPTEACASAYRLQAGFQKVTKLAGVNITTKPSQFSGAMKRVVQAIMGLGNVNDTSPEYLTGRPPTRSKRFIAMQYDYRFVRTHGVVKAGDKNHWLVMISEDDGVLAMPLPLFEHTRGAGYRGVMLARGDTDTVTVLDEFGGLPSGEMFPVGVQLADAIDKGKILRLMSADALQPFYDDNGYFAACGWAFSESGEHADNTCWKRVPLASPTASSKSRYPEPFYRTRGRHWSLRFQLGPHRAGRKPVGEGSCTLSLVHEGYMHDFPRDTPEELAGRTWNLYQGLLLFPASGEAQVRLDLRDNGNESSLFAGKADGAVVLAFYDGERRERLKWNPASIPTLPGSYIYTTFDRGEYSGDTIELRGRGALRNVAAVVPAYCREGYILMTQVGDSGLTSSIQLRGYFPQLGVIDFPTIEKGYQAFFATPPESRPWIDTWFYYFHVDEGQSPQFQCAAVINAGPTPAYVITAGIHHTNELRRDYVRLGQGVEGVGLTAASRPTDISWVGSV